MQHYYHGVSCYSKDMRDTRNVIDKYKGLPLEEIVDDLDQRSHGLEIAVENTERDFNMGTIVRNANAFGVRHVHVIGRKQWNKRGAMMTDKYLHILYYATLDEFIVAMKANNRAIIAIDNIEGSVKLAQTELPVHGVMVFGQEGPGISPELAMAADKIVAIEQFGSTRSVNVGVAAGIVMYEWIRRHRL